ncbi:hypothetical protein EDB87DRAFT_126663 [Lactarius vividus]|nr:hypothetical protein EDB87DRAFT_126663 [Lactarius vividus]
MASWGLDDRGGLFSKATYGDVGFLVASPDPASTKKTFVSVGNISHVLGPLYAKILGEDEPFRKRRLTGHVFEGQFEEMHISEVMTDIVRFTFRNPTSISYQHQFSIHQKPKDDPSEKSARWQSIVANVARFARGSNITPDTMILSRWQLNRVSRLHQNSYTKCLSTTKSNGTSHVCRNFVEFQIPRSLPSTRSALFPLI